MEFLSALLRSMPSAVGQGLIWGIMAIGVYLTYRILEVSDLTVDGSLATGGAVCALLITLGWNPWIALLAAVVAGMLAGLVTGLLHTACGIPAILSGILTQLALYSINLRIMAIGDPSAATKASLAVSVDKFPLLVSSRSVRAFSLENPILLLVLIAAVVVAILYWFFGTELGCSLRATGANSNMARAQGINTDWCKVLGLVVANGLVALSGGLLVQYQGGVTIDMGRGAIVIGLAAVIIGEVLLDKVFRNFALKLTSAVIGAILYYIVITVVLRLGLESTDLKLLTALVVAVFLTIPYWKGKYFGKSAKKGAQRVLKIENIRKTFNAGTVNQKIALNGVSLHLNDGESVAVIGGNGAGKSTLMNAVAGVWPVDEGSISIGGVDVTRLPEHKRAKYIGRVFQGHMMGTAATMQIEENLALAARRGQRRGLSWSITRAEREEYHELLKILDLGLEDRMTSKVGLLSGGQRQALTLLMATMRKPKLLLLDEHTAALDPKTAAKVMEITRLVVNRDKLTTLMITHNMKDAIEYGDRLVMMHNGRIALDISGEAKQNLTVEDLLAQFSKASGEEFASDRALLS